MASFVMARQLKGFGEGSLFNDSPSLGLLIAVV
jgi:hypothetical protein